MVHWLSAGYGHHHGPPPVRGWPSTPSRASPARPLAGHERRHDEQRREAVDAMLASLTDPDEREDFLRIVRGDPIVPRTG